MKFTRRTVCLFLTGLICILPVSGCSSNKITESSTPDIRSSASSDPQSEASTEDNVSDSTSSEENPVPDESKESESDVTAAESFQGRFVRNDPFPDSEGLHLNYELELSAYSDKLYMRILSMNVRYDPESKNDGYDANRVDTENVRLIAAAPYDPSADTFVFNAEGNEITIKYTDNGDLEVNYSGSSEDEYITGTYICQQPAANPFPTLEITHDTKTPDGRMDAGIAENVRLKLGLGPDAEITKEDCNKITKLFAAPQNKPIASLDGIEYLSNLKEIDVADSTVKDISVLSTLTELESISFTNSMIETIPDLSDCQKLKKVAFINDSISDISPLANLQSLQTVMLIEDQVMSIAPLKDNHNIRNLTITNSCISDWESISENEDMKKALFCDYQYYLEVQNKAKKIVAETVTEDMSDIEKQVCLAKYIEDFIQYEFVEEDPDKNVPNGYYGIIESTGVCENYAYAAKYLMRLAGLEVISCSSSDHTWNMIKLDGKWYEFDCTWDDQKEIEDWSWFNRSTSAMSRNDSHCKFIPECMPYAAEDMAFTDYYRFGMLPD